MKLITLNTWAGLLYNPLEKFIKAKSKNTDIFCFQEVFSGAVNPRKIRGKVIPDLYQRLQKLLPDFTGFYAETEANDEGLAMFVKSKLEIQGYGVHFVYGYPNSMIGDDYTMKSSNIQYVVINSGGKLNTVINFHGLWTGGGKEDSDKRLLQSNNLKRFLDNTEGKKILCGDFNLDISTKSLVIVEKGMRNLIKENKVSSTRSHHYKKDTKFADYILVSNDVKVKRFEVVPDVVSDHLPLFLNFA